MAYRVLGSEISKLYGSVMRKAFSSGAILLSPEAAASRASHSGMLDENNRTVSTEQVLHIIDKFVLNSRHIHYVPEKILLTAPHSHWGPNVFITVECDRSNSSILIGQNPIHDSKIYEAVSFVFVDSVPIPMEWLLVEDDTVNEAIGEFWELCSLVAAVLDTSTSGIGLGFDYRGWLSTDVGYSTTIECDLDEERGIIVSSMAYEEIHGESALAEAVSVSWPAVAKIHESRLSPDGADMMNQIRLVVESLDSEKDRITAIAQLIASLEKFPSAK
jgi:hypothetical protein